MVLAIVIYLAIGVRAANTWAHPRRNKYFSATPASFNLEYHDVRLPSRDAWHRDLRMVDSSGREPQRPS